MIHLSHFADVPLFFLLNFESAVYLNSASICLTEWDADISVAHTPYDKLDMVMAL